MRKPEEIRTQFAPREELDRYRSFFLVGIGGAGMAGIAEMLLDRGYRVRGTDSTDQDTVRHLRTKGAQIWIGHRGDPLEPNDAVILTDAIDLNTSPEVARARELGLPLFRRSQALGWLLRDHKVIAVTGTHGKTTTTGMIGAGLRAAGLDPLIVVGAEVPEFGGAVVAGQGEWAVVEACEAYDSFHDLDPEIAVLTNLEPDHLDYHGTWESLRDSVRRFLSRSRRAVLVCEDDLGARELGATLNGKAVLYSADEFARTSREPAVPGEHNRLNASAAILAAELVGANLDQAADGIARFGGAARRLQVMRESSPTVIDDYAHHPTEIQASISALRERYPARRLVVVYQPHLYSRTRDFLPEFARALSAADLLVLTDIYPAREDPIPGVSSARIAEMVTCPVRYVPSRHMLARRVARWSKPADVIVGMGAGNISEFVPALLRQFDRPAKQSVWVVYGGDSAEREVSLLSGRQVAAALQRKGYGVTLVDLSELLLRPEPGLPKERPDVAFLAVHGTHAEDGAVQGLLEILDIPYTGSGIQSSAIAMDKHLTKQILSAEGLPVPRGYRTSDAGSAEAIPGVENYVVKPNAQGSTVGLSFVEGAAGLRDAVEKALAYGATALIEEWVTGIEISVPVLNDRALPVVEIRPKSGRYDFGSKYEPGATEEICPARLTPEQTATAQDYALRAHRALGCRGATRTDMIVKGDRIVILEVNTLPGMTATSLLPNSARTDGIEFDDLCDWIVNDALQRAEADLG